MRGLLDRLARHRRLLLFLPWAGTLLLLVKLGGYRTFLRPEFGALLVGGYLVLILLIAAELFRGEAAPARASVLFSPAILLVPLLYLLNARGAELDGYAFQKRSLGTPRIAGSLPTSPSPSPAGSLPTNDPEVSAFLDRGPRRTQPGAATPDASGTLVLSILDLYRAPEQYDGKLVSIVGMLSRNDELRKQFGTGAMLAFRFRVTCCAADAQPFAVAVLAMQGQPEFPDNAWIQARGRFRLRASGGEKVPVIEDATVSAAAAPVPKYLY
jgi:uncharacterized repeat protein (TIGR03943 family)